MRLVEMPPLRPFHVSWGEILELRQACQQAREKNDQTIEADLILCEKIAKIDSPPLLWLQLTAATITAIKNIVEYVRPKKLINSAFVKSDVAGSSLVMFAGDSANAVGEWETSVTNVLTKGGFQRVWTPYVYRKESHARYQHWLGQQEFFFFPNPEEGSSDEVKHIHEECRNILPMGHKGLNHAIMFQEGRLSFRELPVSYFEIAQIYTAGKDGPVNELGLYLSMFCHPDVMDMACATIYAAIAECGNAHKKIRLITHKIRSGIAPEGDLRYVTAGNALADGGLVLARARFQYSNGDGI